MNMFLNYKCWHTNATGDKRSDANNNCGIFNMKCFNGKGGWARGIGTAGATQDCIMREAPLPDYQNKISDNMLCARTIEKIAASVCSNDWIRMNVCEGSSDPPSYFECDRR